MKQFISKEKKDKLELRMKELKINKSEISEQFILGSGKGGQKVNKTYSGVQLRYAPKDILIQVTAHRDRELNRYKARQNLCDQIETLLLGKESPIQKKIKQKQKQKKRRYRRNQEKNKE